MNANLQIVIDLAEQSILDEEAADTPELEEHREVQVRAVREAKDHFLGNGGPAVLPRIDTEEYGRPGNPDWSAVEEFELPNGQKLIRRTDGLGGDSYRIDSEGEPTPFDQIAQLANDAHCLLQDVLDLVSNTGHQDTIDMTDDAMTFVEKAREVAYLNGGNEDAVDRKNKQLYAVSPHDEGVFVTFEASNIPLNDIDAEDLQLTYNVTRQGLVVDLTGTTPDGTREVLKSTYIDEPEISTMLSE